MRVSHLVAGVAVLCSCKQLLGIEDEPVFQGDSGIHVDANLSDGSGLCSVASSYTPTFDSMNFQVAQNDGSDTSDTPPLYSQSVLWQGVLATTPEVFLSIVVFGGGGSNTPDFPAALGPASVTVDLASPDVEAVIGANIVGNMANDLYFAGSGNLDITAAGPTGQFTGTATGLQFIHGSVDGSNNFVPNPDGCSSSIPSMSFDAPITIGSGSGSGSAAFTGSTYGIKLLPVTLRRRFR